MKRTVLILAVLGSMLNAVVSGQTNDESKGAVNTNPDAMIDLRRVGVSQDQVLTLSLDGAVRMALNNNNDIELARDDVKVNEKLLLAAEGVYDPVISSTSSFRRNSFRGANSWNTFSTDVGFLQSFRKGGGSITPIFTTSRTGNYVTGPNGELQQSFFNQSSLGVAFTQPLFRNRKIDNNRRQIRIRKKVLEQSDADFRRKTIEKIFQVQQAYWDLVFALSDQKNRLDNLNLSKENLKKVEMQIEDGAEPPLARAEVETELANREVDVFEAERRVAEVENALKHLVLPSMTSTEWSRTFVPTDKPNLNPIKTSLAEAMTDAVNNRPELVRLKQQQEISAIEMEYFGNQTKPRIDFNAGVSLDGFAVKAPQSSGNSALIDINSAATNADAFLLSQVNIVRNDPRLNLGNVSNIPTVPNSAINSPIVGGTFKSIRNLFSPNAANFSAGVTINFPFKNKIAEAELARVDIERHQVETQIKIQELQVYTEVRNALQNVESAAKKMTSAQKARENAEIQLQGEKELFDTGRSSRFLLFQRENALVNARNAEISSQIEYNKAVAALQQTTSTTLRANGILID
ncbi:MAG TPA: TolC family protein [Pyrinomonadaceae bacterium]|nr:TolC family protein [Pyrinomonadaceae bacterium]